MSFDKCCWICIQANSSFVLNYLYVTQEQKHVDWDLLWQTKQQADTQRHLLILRNVCPNVKHHNVVTQRSTLRLLLFMHTYMSIQVIYNIYIYIHTCLYIYIYTRLYWWVCMQVLHNFLLSCMHATRAARHSTSLATLSSRFPAKSATSVLPPAAFIRFNDVTHPAQWLDT
jgi:hypothetical protein